MIHKWLIVVALMSGLVATATAQEEAEKAEAQEAQKAEPKSDPKALEFLGKVDEKLYNLQSAGAKDVKVAMSSSQLNEMLGGAELKFVLLWKKGKETMRVEGLPAAMQFQKDQLTEVMSVAAKQYSMLQPLSERVKDFVVTMEKDGDLTKVTMAAKDEGAMVPQEVYWYDSRHLPVKMETTQQSQFGEMTQTAELKLKQLDLEGGQEKWVVERVEQKSAMGEEVINIAYRETDNGFYVVEKLSNGNEDQPMQLDFAVEVNQGIPDSEFSG